MVIFPTCKINLGLSITGKRADGFHNIETVLFPLGLRDALEIIPSGKGFHFQASGLNIPGDPLQNLVVKAYKLIDREHRIGPVVIHLHKNIPAGAGLGGGSSDAAHAIMLLNRLFSLGLSTGIMEEYARALGSDCAFFIRNEPVMAFQRGDQFRKVSVDLGGYRILIVKPGITIDTGQAYGWIKPSVKKLTLEDIICLPIKQWNEHLINDFEIPVFERYPALLNLKLKILHCGAVYASMTGTGSAVFGIFKNSANLPGKKEFQECFVWHS